MISTTTWVTSAEILGYAQHTLRAVFLSTLISFYWYFFVENVIGLQLSAAYMVTEFATSTGTLFFKEDGLFMFGIGLQGIVVIFSEAGVTLIM